MTTSLRQIRSAQGPLLLLLLAVFAHLSLGVVSATHHARMIGADGSAAICTLYGVKRVALPPELLSAAGLDQPVPSVQITDCPLCASASFGGPPSAHSLEPAYVSLALEYLAVMPAGPSPARSFGLVPPSRAPPLNA